MHYASGVFHLILASSIPWAVLRYFHGALTLIELNPETLPRWD